MIRVTIMLVLTESISKSRLPAIIIVAIYLVFAKPKPRLPATIIVALYFALSDIFNFTHCIFIFIVIRFQVVLRVLNKETTLTYYFGRFVHPRENSRQFRRLC